MLKQKNICTLLFKMNIIYYLCTISISNVDNRRYINTKNAHKKKRNEHN